MMGTYTHLAMVGHMPWAKIKRQVQEEIDEAYFKILVLLAESPMAAWELAEKLPHEDSNVNSAILMLLNQGLIYHDGHRYYLRTD